MEVLNQNHNNFAMVGRVNFYGKIFYNSELRFGKQKVIMSAVIVSFDLS